jgi:hypothetical protein
MGIHENLTIVFGCWFGDFDAYAVTILKLHGFIHLQYKGGIVLIDCRFDIQMFCFRVKIWLVDFGYLFVLVNRFGYMLCSVNLGLR